jgi:hypothetical protein
MGGAGPMTGAAAVSMVRNECDIIELFVRINLRTFEHVFIVDHGSSDGTAEILSRLQAEGLPLTTSTLGDIHQTQAETLTGLMREVAESGRYRYIVPLDADEFLTVPSGWNWASLAPVLGDQGYGLIPWKTFVPVSGDYFSAAAPLYLNFRQRSSEPVQYYKVVVPAEVATRGRLEPGSHALMDTSADVRPVKLDLDLLHVPVRSSAQMVQKAVLGSHTLSIKRNRLPLEGFHWDAMATDIRARNYQLDEATLLDYALRYGVDGEASEAHVKAMESGPRVGLSTDTIVHRDLARIQPMVAFDAFMGRACAEINALNAQVERLSAEMERSWLRRLGLWRHRPS